MKNYISQLSTVPRNFLRKYKIS